MSDLIQINPNDPFAKLRASVNSLLHDLPKKFYEDRQEFFNDVHTILAQRPGQFPAGYAFRSLIAWATKYEYIRKTKDGWHIKPNNKQ